MRDTQTSTPTAAEAFERNRATNAGEGDDRPDADDVAGALHRCGACAACRAWGVGL